MTPLPVEEPPSKIGVRLRIKYNRTTCYCAKNLIYICIIKNVMHCLVAVAFFSLGHPVCLKRCYLNSF